MVMLPAVVVSRAVLVLLVGVVSARAANVSGAASSAAVAAESIKRCFKIQTSLIVGQGLARSPFKPLIWLRPSDSRLGSLRLGPPGLFPGPPLYPARAPVQQQIFTF